MKVAIFGSEGYVGSELSFRIPGCHRLDLCWFGQTSKDVHIKDFDSLSVFDISAFDVIVLLAGHSSVKMCVGDWHSAFNNNVRNFTSLVHKIEKSKKNIKFIYASSSSVYGNTRGEIVDESYINKDFNNEYDITKSMIDTAISISSKIEWYGLRFGTVNGFSKNLRRELMMNSMCWDALTKAEVRITNPEIHRAIIGMDDLCSAIEAIIKFGTTEKKGFYNISSFNSTVQRISDRIVEKTGAKLVVGEDLPNPYDFRLSNSKFENVFNFKFKETIDTVASDLIDNIPNGSFINTRNDLHAYA
jgi:nucleoside-diphosphate-sugar epimerase